MLAVAVYDLAADRPSDVAWLCSARRSGANRLAESLFLQRNEEMIERPLHHDREVLLQMTMTHQPCGSFELLLQLRACSELHAIARR